MSSVQPHAFPSSSSRILKDKIKSLVELGSPQPLILPSVGDSLLFRSLVRCKSVRCLTGTEIRNVSVGVWLKVSILRRLTTRNRYRDKGNVLPPFMIEYTSSQIFHYQRYKEEKDSCISKISTELYFRGCKLFHVHHKRDGVATERSVLSPTLWSGSLFL